jgi:hypothetical protein
MPCGFGLGDERLFTVHLTQSPDIKKDIALIGCHYEVIAMISAGVFSAMPSFSSVVPVET